MFKDSDSKYLRQVIKGMTNSMLEEPYVDKEIFLKGQFAQKQQEFITCTEQYQTLFGGKRGGKSVSGGGAVIYTDQWVMPDKPGVLFYASTTTEQAKRLVLKRLQQAQKGLDLKWHYQLNKNMIQTERNVILFGGLKDLKAVYSYQGTPFKLIIIDEPQFVKDLVLKTFIMDVASLGMVDFEGTATCRFIGNPFPVHSGYLWDMVQSPEVAHFNINLMDNPEISHEAKLRIIEKELKIRGETMETLSNSSRRLIFGEWAEDTSSLVLDFKDKDIYTEIPEDAHIITCSGCDLGFDDKTALAVVKYDLRKDILYIDYEFQEKGMTMLPLVEKYKEILSIYNTEGMNTIDTQGGGKQTAVSLSSDYGIPLMPAKKGDKMHYVNLLRSYNRQGKIKVKPESSLANEAKHILFANHNKSLDDDYFHSDIFHAVLYAFRHIYIHHISDKAEEKKVLTPVEDFLERMKKSQQDIAKDAELKDYGLNSD